MPLRGVIPFELGSARMEDHGPGELNGGGRYLLFVWSAKGYELREREGELPAVGAEIEDGELRYRVSKHAPSPLPGDARRCAYLMPV